MIDMNRVLNSSNTSRGTSATTWRTAAQQLVPRCPGCGARARIWNGFWGEASGVKLGGEWFCRTECLDSVLASRFHSSICQCGGKRRLQANRMPLGLALMERGLISQDDLRRALDLQIKSGGLLGQLLSSTGIVDETTITSVVASQWCCPVFPAASVLPGCGTLVPSHLLDLYKMLPVHYSPASGKLFVAFENAVDASVLYAIGTMLQCGTEPCFLESSTLAMFRDRVRQGDSSRDIVIDEQTVVEDMAQITRSYITQCLAKDFRHVVCGDHVWARLECERVNINLLFRRQTYSLHDRK